jgi:glycosyltransferase involved in cell wall biosynthesis
MRDKPIVSVVMPVYNGQTFLSVAIESVLVQTFSQFEFVIIDDGSTDRTPEILSGFEAVDKRIRVIRQENKGIVAALNNGIKNSSAEIIARMDADDISLPDRLSEQVEYLNKHSEVSVVSCFSQMVDKTGKVIHGIDSFPITHNEILWKLCFSNPIVHPGVMFRKDVFQKVDGYRNGFLQAEDYDLWVRLAQITCFYSIPKILIQIRKHSNNITSVNVDECLQNSIKISQRAMSQLLSQEVPIEKVKPFWERTDDNLQSVNILGDIRKLFLLNYRLKKGEYVYIKRDTIRRMANLAHINSFNMESTQILVEMLKFAPLLAVSEFFRRVIKKIGTKLWTSCAEFFG